MLSGVSELESCRDDLKRESVRGSEDQPSQSRSRSPTSEKGKGRGGEGQRERQMQKEVRATAAERQAEEAGTTRYN